MTTVLLFGFLLCAVPEGWPGDGTPHDDSVIVCRVLGVDAQAEVPDGVPRIGSKPSGEFVR